MKKKKLTPVKVKVQRGKIISTIIDVEVSVREDVMLPWLHVELVVKKFYIIINNLLGCLIMIC